MYGFKGGFGPEATSPDRISLPKPCTPLWVAGFWCGLWGLGFRVRVYRVWGPEKTLTLNPKP